MEAPKIKILVADDDTFIRDDLRDLLSSPSHELMFAATAAAAWEIVERENPDIVLLDLKFPDSNDLRLLKRIRAEYPDIEVIIISGQTEKISMVVDALHAGCFDYVPKPFVREELLNRVEKALALQSSRRAQKILLDQVEQQSGLRRLIGDSTQMLQVRDLIRKFSDSENSVLISGESGTGKELVARALHFLGKRRGDPFLVVNCAAIPETLVESILFGHKKGAFTGAFEASKGQFEAVGKGTLFLDEIGDMPLSQQASLLRVLESRRFTRVGEHQERECHARFVFATNRDLREWVRAEKFRADLYYRINVGTIALPPLRSRSEDVLPIADYYLSRLTADMGRRPVTLDPGARKVLAEYDWPGNIRELRNVLESALMIMDSNMQVLDTKLLPPEILASQLGADNAAERLEKEQLFKALQQSNGNQTKAAEILGWHRNTVRMKLRQYGISNLLKP